VLGKLRPTRLGEYVLMDSTWLDVFALDPVTLRWVSCEFTVAMDWHAPLRDRHPAPSVSTKTVDDASVLFRVFRPRPAVRTGRRMRCGASPTPARPYCSTSTPSSPRGAAVGCAGAGNAEQGCRLTRGRE
jgi:hypothetical protein